MCKKIGLADEINRIVGVDPRQKVTCGEAVVAMVLNDIEKNVLANSNIPTTEHLQERISNYLEVEYPKKI